MKRLRPSPIQLWIILALSSSMIVGLVYITQQQHYRQSANDPQIQLAQDGATAFRNGTDPTQIVGDDHVEIASSLAPFVTIYDQDQDVLATSGTFMGQAISPPAGSFDYAKAHGEHRFTWAPRPGSREAAVLVYTSGGAHSGYVLAARSLDEVENREQGLLMVSAFVLAIMLAGSSALLYLGHK